MATQALNLRLDAEEKDRFVELTRRIGISPSDAVRVFVYTFNRDGGFPFSVTAQTYSPISSEGEAMELTRGISRRALNEAW